jgi:hypothetical protein
MGAIAYAIWLHAVIQGRREKYLLLTNKYERWGFRAGHTAQVLTLFALIYYRI